MRVAILTINQKGVEFTSRLPSEKPSMKWSTQDLPKGILVRVGELHQASKAGYLDEQGSTRKRDLHGLPSHDALERGWRCC